MPRAYLAIKLKNGEPTQRWFAATSMPNLKTVLAERKAPDGDYKIEQHILNKNNSQQLCELLMRRKFSEHILMTATGSVEDGVLSIKRGSTEKHEKPTLKAKSKIKKTEKEVKSVKGKHPKNVKKLFKNKKK